jgi:hypothetical protein
MTDPGWRRFHVVALLVLLVLGWSWQGTTMNVAALGAGMSMSHTCNGCDDPGKDGPCPPAWCSFCPALLPACPVLLNGSEMVVLASSDEHGRGLALRPHPPPPRFLLYV